MIGSFDSYIETTKHLIKENRNITDEEIELFLKEMPTNYRAAIENKNGEYIRYIVLYDIDAKNGKIKIGIDSKLKYNVGGKTVINNFCDKLFFIGVISVTGAIFEFNNLLKNYMKIIST